VQLIVSDGPAPVAVPDVSGKSYTDAAALLTAKRFQPVRQDVFSSTVAVGVAVGTTPAAGAAAPRDSPVAVLISKGPEMVQVPNEVGKTVEAASQDLTNRGLRPDVQNYGPGKTVKAQAPGAGTSVTKGSSVTLYL
jgi:serine/threonine-protein kinase